MNRYDSYKDTGLDWQRKIPYNWELVRLKKIAYFNTGNSIKDEEKGKYSKHDDSRMYISTSDIDSNNMEINHKSNIYIPLKSKSFKVATKGSTLVCVEGGNGGKKAALATENVNFGNKLCAIKTGNKNTTVENYKKIYEDDIVVNIMLCWMGAIGISKYNGVTSPAYDIYKPNLELVVPEYYHYMFRTNKFRSELFKRGKGIVLMKWRVYSDKFKNIIVPLPDIDEQKRIIGLIEEKKEIILGNISIIKRKLTTLKELKQSLISEVVTGKIDVRNVVIPEYKKVTLLDDEIEEFDETEGIEDGD